MQWLVRNMRTEIDCGVIMEHCLRVWRATYSLPEAQRRYTQTQIWRDQTYMDIQSTLAFMAMRLELYDRSRRIKDNDRHTDNITRWYSDGSQDAFGHDSEWASNISLKGWQDSTGLYCLHTIGMKGNEVSKLWLHPTTSVGQQECVGENTYMGHQHELTDLWTNTSQRIFNGYKIQPHLTRWSTNKYVHTWDTLVEDASNILSLTFYFQSRE